MKFKHDIEAQAGFKDKDGQLGSAGQILSSTGSQTDWVDQSTLSAESAEVVEIPVKNLQGSALTKGDPVYISGTVGASGILEVKLADAGVSTKMPAVGLLKQDLAINGEGFVVVTGKLRNLVTSPIDGATPNEGDVVYVKSGGSTGAALTTTKPTGSSNLIQNMGKVGRVSTAADGTYVVSSILRSNDVPNLSTGKIWVGDGNTVESTVVHLDETNGRMGIGTSTPSYKLDVNGSIRSGGNYLGSNSAYTYLSLANGNSHHKFYTKTNTTAASERFTIEGGAATTNAYFSNVNVGIGTTSPSRKLQVIGTDGAAKFYYNSSFTNAQYPVVDIGMMTSGTAANGFGPKINFRMGENGYDGYVSGSIGTVRNGADGTHNMTFGTSTSGSTSTKMTITNTGNVGIGTTGPSYKLDLQGDLRVDNGDLGGTSGDEVTHAKIHGQRHFLEFKEVRTANGTDWKDTTYKLQAGVDATDHQSIDFVADGSYQEHIDIRTGNQLFHSRFDSSGRLGIGTTSPSQKLHVYNGTAYVTPISYAASQSGYALRIGAYNSTSFDMGLQLKSTSGGSPYMSFKTSSIDDALTIWGGSVGIGGIGIPSYTLDVDGQIRGEQYLRLADTGGTNRFSIRAESTYGTIDNGSNTLNYNANNHLFLVGLSEKMRINSSGNVGVATTSPSQKFHVNGNALVESVLYIDDTSSSIYRFFNELIIQNTASTSISIGGGPGSVTNNLEVNGVVTATAATDAYKGYIKSIITTGYSMKSASTAYQYIPYNSYLLTTSQAYYNRTVAAYNGRVKKIIVKRIDGASADATGMKFKKEINGTVIATEYTATVLSGSGNFQATYNFANSDFTFSAGDSIGILMQSSGGTGMIGAGAIQIVLEYNIT